MRGEGSTGYPPNVERQVGIDLDVGFPKQRSDVDVRPHWPGAEFRKYNAAYDQTAVLAGSFDGAER